MDIKDNETEKVEMLPGTDWPLVSTEPVTEKIAIKTYQVFGPEPGDHGEDHVLFTGWSSPEECAKKLAEILARCPFQDVIAFSVDGGKGVHVSIYQKVG